MIQTVARVSDATPKTIDVRNPFDGSLVDKISCLDPGSISRLLSSAGASVARARNLARHERSAILERTAEQIRDRSEEFARLIVAESGKTIRQARSEVARCCNTLKLSAVEATRNAGEIVPFDSYPSGQNRFGWFTREPLGLVAAITPYNDPLNLVAHKLGPAIAGGNAVILKVSELAPLSGIKLVETLESVGLPKTVISVAVGGADVAQAILEERLVRMVSFTGGFSTGRRIAEKAGLKKLAMELGGNAPVIVLGDADVEESVAACVSGAYWAAGQNCIGTQRIFVDRSILKQFLEGFVASTAVLVAGDPADEWTDVGPMITEGHAQLTMSRIAAAVSEGACVLIGGRRDGAVVWPTVLTNLPHTNFLWEEEAFAPVVSIEPFDSLDQAIELANGIEYSLHAAVFTNDLEHALALAGRIEAGAVIINDSSDYRHDAMPFGGFKYGSMGREGVRFAFEEMTQPKVVCIKRSGSPIRAREVLTAFTDE